MVAHDNKKVELLTWAEYNGDTLRQNELFATGTTGTLLKYELGLDVRLFLFGPMGGGQQVGGKIAEGETEYYDLLLGSVGAPTARHRRQGIAAVGGAVEHGRWQRISPRRT